MFIELKDPEAGLFPPARLAEILASAMFFLAEELTHHNCKGNLPTFNPNGMTVSQAEPDGVTITVSGWDTHVQMVVMLEQSEEATVPSPVRVFVKSSPLDTRLIPIEDSEFGFMAGKSPQPLL